MKTTGTENLQTVGGLFACPDCQHRCSNFAESCPSCGRYFRVYARNFTVVPGGGWSMAVFWGIMLAWIIPTLLAIGLFVVLFVIGAIGAASLTPTRNSPSLQDYRK
jgi:hypothetical protein